MAKSTKPKSLEEQRAGFVKRSGRQSKNIVDLRDISVGPKKTKVQTKAYKKDNTIGKMEENRYKRIGTVGYDRMVDKGDLRDIEGDLETFQGNDFVNYYRKTASPEVAKAIKNKDLKTGGKFAKFFKHTQKDNFKTVKVAK